MNNMHIPLGKAKIILWKPCWSACISLLQIQLMYICSRIRKKYTQNSDRQLLWSLLFNITQQLRTHFTLIHTNANQKVNLKWTLPSIIITPYYRTHILSHDFPETCSDNTRDFICQLALYWCRGTVTDGAFDVTPSMHVA